MCLGNKAQAAEPAQTVAPAETLNQVAPEKKTAVTAAKDGNALAIGTKKYRNESGLGASGLNTGSPSGLSLSK